MNSNILRFGLGDFSVESTGGNCRAYVHQTSGGVSFLLTDGDAGVNFRDRVVVSRLLDDGSEDPSEETFSNLSEAIDRVRAEVGGNE